MKNQVRPPSATIACAELRASAQSHGWDLDPSIEIFELAPPESVLDAAQQQSLIYAADLELGETTQKLFDAVERAAPDRVVLDSLSEVRLLARLGEHGDEWVK